ncbi:transcription initiation factor TFIID subunit 5-like [Artemia franciscana]|uniref:Transcription initiation factor TFIID subunit 5 n=1 Tax=Artemia franciscana TaxID=6661 RepID=A0AA88I0T7_ARTSF|nr:hypothetical protein QYM36_005106 [Artemia franciscana]KAK2719508.1 hypothetical protein QYM36_005106 [Artemia franciscana]KAK2719509.1 hypothetical protein QYM36_005106 [Artemia franciscana]KAK2719510.1 hypothetical protein QYM36_005106 [Artemia franciscana]KAK2719511.1 hypothetical protein QYM36_005106 [Artemia franciscana]
MASVDSNDPANQRNVPDDDKKSLMFVLNYLRKRDLRATEDLLRKETGLSENEADGTIGGFQSLPRTTGSDPKTYIDSYKSFSKYIDQALDSYRPEMSLVRFPVFVHMYLQLVESSNEDIAKQFMDKFSVEQEDWFQDDIIRLKNVVRNEQLYGNEFVDSMKNADYTIRMSKDVYSSLKRFLSDPSNKAVSTTIRDHIQIDSHDGLPRSKETVESLIGSRIGESSSAENKAKVFYGLLREPDIQYTSIEIEDNENGELAPEGEKPKKKKIKKDSLYGKKSRNDPNAPPNNRIPLPELREVDVAEKKRAVREAEKRVAIGAENLPSICFYTMMNSSEIVTCIEIAEDSSLIAAGFSDSSLKVFSLTPQKLRTMKPAEQLLELDREAEDVLARMMDERTGEHTKTLHGHSGPVYDASFSPDRTMLLSCSEDTTIRLWSLQVWSCLVVYKGHQFPVWSVKFSPHGYYFASGGYDRTGRLWATDHPQPLRMFAGHHSDVDVVQFHPNSNYVVTGSTDRCIRMWDVLTGKCVFNMTGHKASIQCLSFSPDGRFLASGDRDGHLHIWDLAHEAAPVAQLPAHDSVIYSITFGRGEGNVIASGSMDYSVALWDFGKITEDLTEDAMTQYSTDVKKNVDGFLLGRYPTKKTAVLALHFSRRNLLIGAGMFEG